MSEEPRRCRQTADRQNAGQVRGNVDERGRATTSDHGRLSLIRPLPRYHRHRRRRRRSRRAAIIRSSLIKLREMSKDSAMLGKTDNADADYYIPRRPIHSSARVGPPTRSCVRARARGRVVCACAYVCRSVSTRTLLSSEKHGHAHTPACTHVRVLSRRSETGVNVLHLCKLARSRRSDRYNYSIRD